MTTAAAKRLRVHGNPLRMLGSAAPWRASAYLAGYLVAGSGLFAVATAAVLAGAVFSQLTLALPLVVGAAWTVRGCAQVERGRAALVGPPLPYHYREVTEPGLAAHIRTRCTDPAALRDCAYLVLMFPVLLLLDAVALAAWLLPLAGISLPLWYWAVRMSGPDGTPGHGVNLGYQHSAGAGWGLRVDHLPTALGVSVACLALALPAAYLVTAAAQLHLAVARTLLGPPRDPLAPAKAMLAEPGPLAAWRTSPFVVPLADREEHESDTDPAR